MRQRIFNEIVVDPACDMPRMILRHLLNIREESSLLIMATSVKELDWKASHEALVQSFQKKIHECLEVDQIDLSRVSYMIRYRDHEKRCMRALSVTLGRKVESRTYEEDFLRDVETFIARFPSPQNRDYLSSGFDRYCALPALRMALMIHALKPNLETLAMQGDLEHQGLALQDFNSNEWRYRVAYVEDAQEKFLLPCGGKIENKAGSDFRVVLESNDFSENSFFLKVSRPHRQMHPNHLDETLVFRDDAKGFHFHQVKKHYRGPRKDYKAKYVNTGKQMGDDWGGIISHEAYWGHQLDQLLTHAGIKYKYKALNISHDVFVKDAFWMRRLDLTQDFLGLDTETIAADGVLKLAWYLAPSAYAFNDERTPVTTHQALELLFNRINEDLQQIKGAMHLKLIEVKEANQADLIIGKYDEKKSWTAATEDEELDPYGEEKRTDAALGKINTQQFISFRASEVKAKKPNKRKKVLVGGQEVLEEALQEGMNPVEIEQDNFLRGLFGAPLSKFKRGLSEVLVKKWINQDQAKRCITVSGAPWESSERICVVGSVRVKQRKKSKPEMMNVHHICFQVSGQDDEMVFSRPEVYRESKQTEKSESFPEFDSAYDLLADEKLKQIEPILIMMDRDTSRQEMLAAIGDRYNRNDAMLFFQHDGERILSVWSTDAHELWVLPELNGNVLDEDSLQSFVEREKKKGSYTKSSKTSKADHEKRLKADPFYEVMVDRNTVVVRRRRHNLDQVIGRHQARRFVRLHPAGNIQSESEYRFITAGLLSPEAGAFEQSGISKTIYEKVMSSLLF